MSRVRKLGVQADSRFLQRLLAVGHAFDVNKDGLYDARSGAVNIWCSPTDKPACWNDEVLKGGLNYPRDYVGGIYWEWGDLTADLYIDADAYELVRHKQKLHGSRATLSEEEWTQVLDWLELKARELLRLTDLQPNIVGTKCPLCDFVLPEGRLINELMTHMGEHGNVTSITLGHPTKVTIDGSEYDLEPAESFGG